MRALSRLFRKRQNVPPPESRPAEPAPVAPAEESAAAHEAPAPPQQSPAATEDRPPVPLRSLTRYQHDPAFQNFVQKLKRPPGAAQRRRLNPDEIERKR
jgi:hypothetical protein